MRGSGLPHDGIVVLGPASPSVRRRVGPLAWCALEALYQRAELIGDVLLAEISQSALARELGVAKNTAHRALKTLRSAGLLEHDQTRGVAGRFDGSRYRLTVSQDVIARSALNQARPVRPPRRRSNSGGRRQIAARPDAGEFGEQLVLVPPA
jgi:DNA-binding MarR family transcriptional regulator